MEALKVITPPTLEPVSVKEVMDWGGIEAEDAATILETMAIGARELVEKHLNRALMEQTIVIGFDAWPDNGRVELPRPPAISITEVRIFDDAGDSTVIDSDAYWLDDISSPNILRMISGSESLMVPTRDEMGIEVEYKAGYGDESGDVPAGIRAGIMQGAVDIWDTRIFELSGKAKTLLEPYRIMVI